jgi:hypothetical protein
VNSFELANRFSDFWRDFNRVHHWRFRELPPCDLLRSLQCDLSDVDYAEFVRAQWMWTRKPKSFLGDGLSGYLSNISLHRIGDAFSSLCRNYPRTRLVLRNATGSRERCGSSRALAPRIRIEHRPRNSKSQKSKVDAGAAYRSGTDPAFLRA